MAWTYGDWRQQSGRRAQLDRLDLHLQEVADKMSSADVASDGHSASRGTQQRYYETLLEERARLVKELGAVVGPRLARRG